MTDPTYYAIIPANVRYSKEVCPNAKLLYGEITALSNKEGFCWASNGYFADLYGVKPAVISRWVSSLRKAGFINVQIENQTERKIYLRFDPIPKSIDPYTKKYSDPILKSIHNTKVNIKTNNKEKPAEEIPNLKAKETENQARIDFKDIEDKEVGKDMGSSVETARNRSESVVEWDEDGDEIKKTSPERKGEFDALNWFDSLSRENPGMDTSKLTEGEKVVKSFGSFPTDWNWKRERVREKQLYKTHGADGVYRLLWGLNQLRQTSEWWQRIDLRFTSLSTRIIELIGERNGFTGNGTANEKEKQVDRGNRERENGTLQNRTESDGIGDTRRPDNIKLDRTGT